MVLSVKAEQIKVKYEAEVHYKLTLWVWRWITVRWKNVFMLESVSACVSACPCVCGGGVFGCRCLHAGRSACMSERDGLLKRPETGYLQLNEKEIVGNITFVKELCQLEKNVACLMGCREKEAAHALAHTCARNWEEEERDELGSVCFEGIIDREINWKTERESKKESERERERERERGRESEREMTDDCLHLVWPSIDVVPLLVGDLTLLKTVTIKKSRRTVLAAAVVLVVVAVVVAAVVTVVIVVAVVVDSPSALLFFLSLFCSDSCPTIEFATVAVCRIRNWFQRFRSRL